MNTPFTRLDLIRARVDELDFGATLRIDGWVVYNYARIESYRLTAPARARGTGPASKYYAYPEDIARAIVAGAHLPNRPRYDDGSPYMAVSDY